MARIAAHTFAETDEFYLTDERRLRLAEWGAGNRFVHRAWWLLYGHGPAPTRRAISFSWRRDRQHGPTRQPHHLLGDRAEQTALVDGMETTLKRFYKEPNEQVRLQPANPAMQPIVVSTAALQIQGRVLAVLRKYK